MICYYFPSEAVLPGIAKTDTTDKQIVAEIQPTLKHVPGRKLTEEKM